MSILSYLFQSFLAQKIIRIVSLKAHIDGKKAPSCGCRMTFFMSSFKIMTIFSKLNMEHVSITLIVKPKIPFANHKV